MKNTDPRIDQYILKSQEFAIPILEYLRKLVHKACPGCQETMKWSFPHFEYKGEILFSMASFKKHCAIGFWKEKLMTKSKNLLTDKGKTAMWDFGKIMAIKDLPSAKILTQCIQEAMELNEAGIKLTKNIKKINPKDIIVPPDFQKVLNKNPKEKKHLKHFQHHIRRNILDTSLKRSGKKQN